MFYKKSVLLFCLLTLISAISFSTYAAQADGESVIDLEQSKLPPEMSMRAFNDLGPKELCALRLTSTDWKSVADKLISDNSLLNIVFTPEIMNERDPEAILRIGSFVNSIGIIGYEGPSDNVTKLIEVLDDRRFPNCSKLFLIGNKDFGLCDNEYNLYKIIKNLPAIKELVLLGNQLNMLSTMQGAAMGCLKRLQSLRFICNKVDDLQLFLIVSCANSGCFPKMVDLDMRGNDITSVGLAFLSCITHDCLPELTNIDISMNKQLDTTGYLDTQQTKSAIEAILKNNPKVTAVNMMHSGMDNGYLKFLSKSYPSVIFSYPNIAYLGSFMRPEQLLGFAVEAISSIFGGSSNRRDRNYDSDSDTDSDSDDGCIIQ